MNYWLPRVRSLWGDGIVVGAVVVRSRLLSACAVAVSVLVLASGCALFVRAAVQVALRIATSVVVEAGAEYVRKILSSDEADGSPTIMVSFTNTSGDGVGEFYAIDGVDGISIKDFVGDIHLVGNDKEIAITVAAGTSATIEIVSSAGGGGQSVTANARDQAITIDGIISWSARSRSDLNNVALPDLQACRNVLSATDTLRSVADGRARQLDALEDLDVSALSDGASIRDTLIRALSYSLDADLAFVRWAEYIQAGGCGYDANYDEAMRHSQNATATKREFVNIWNPVARMYGLPERVEWQV